MYFFDDGFLARYTGKFISLLPTQANSTRPVGKTNSRLLARWEKPSLICLPCPVRLKKSSLIRHAALYLPNHAVKGKKLKRCIIKRKFYEQL